MQKVGKLIKGKLIEQLPMQKAGKTYIRQDKLPGGREK